MPKVISVVGRSNSGKTTLLEKVVKELARRGYRIGTIKHDTHGFEIDYPGKDSYRHFHAGSVQTMILGPAKLSLVRRLPKPLGINDVLKLFGRDLDLVITEGFKRGDKPKIEVVRRRVSSEPLCRNKGDNLKALVTDSEITGYSVPVFNLNDVRKITDFIEEEFICQEKRKR